MSKILIAAELARRYHLGQTRKHNGRPYLTHLCRVAGRVATRAWADEDDVAAGYLHDIEEEIGSSSSVLHAEIKEKIINLCGHAVWSKVAALSNPSRGMNASREERKKLDREHLARQPQNIKGIKLIDRIDNLDECLRDIQSGVHWDLTFHQTYANESELLLLEALKGTDLDLEVEMIESIAALREAVTTWLGRKAVTVVEIMKLLCNDDSSLKAFGMVSSEARFKIMLDLAEVLKVALVGRRL